MERILIVEDDKLINDGVKAYLCGKGYECVSAHDLYSARLALTDSFHLVLLDIKLPDGSGLELCREIRKTSRVPIIFLTANDTDADMIEGFQQGCDDYISKPFSLDVLLQRIIAVLRRSSSEEKLEVYTYQDLSVDFEKRKVCVRNEPVKLSATEFKLLELLIKNKGQVLTRDIILSRIWDIDENFVDDSTLSVHVRRLRQKLERDAKNPEYIITVFGIGYTFGK